MELKVQKSFNVVVQLDEAEATRLAAILVQTVSFEEVPLARELYDALAEALENGSPERSLRLKYDKAADMFVPRGDK
jgi:hypothetical protein